MGKVQKIKKTLRLVALILGGIVVLLVAAEVGYRVHVDGSAQAWSRLGELFFMPISTFGAGHALVADEELGFRRNPARKGVNKRSMRHKPILMPKAHGLFRVVIMGDAVAPHQPGFVVRLRKIKIGQDQKLEVINAGTPGYTAYQQVHFYETYLEELAPNLVIWTYSMDDNHRFSRRYHKGKAAFTEEVMRNLHSDSGTAELLNRSYLLARLRLGHLTRHPRAAPSNGYTWEADPAFSIAWKDHSWGEYSGQLNRLHDMIEVIQSRLSIMVIPLRRQVELRRHNDLAHVLKPQSRVSELCIEHRIHCMDLFAEFADAFDRKEKLYRADGVHLNTRGHALVYKQLAKFLTEKELLPK